MVQPFVHPVRCCAQDFVCIVRCAQFVRPQLRVVVVEPLHIPRECHLLTALIVNIDLVVPHSDAVGELFLQVLLDGLHPVCFRHAREDVLFHLHERLVVRGLSDAILLRRASCPAGFFRRLSCRSQLCRLPDGLLILLRVGAECVDSRISVRIDLFLDGIQRFVEFRVRPLCRHIVDSSPGTNVCLDDLVKFFLAERIPNVLFDLRIQSRRVVCDPVVCLMRCQLINSRPKVVRLNDDPVSGEHRRCARCAAV